jgi:SAM-dependent methyltransferase
MTRPEIDAWDARFAGEEYLFGTDPNEFLAREASRIPVGGRVLVVADGEGRNGVWLAAQGLAVHATEGSRTAITKSARLAQRRDVPVAASPADLAPGSIAHEHADLLSWEWPVGAYDAVVAIFIQFARPDERGALFAGMAAALKPGGILLLEGYHRRQMEFGTGGPRVLEQLYDEELMRSSFAGLHIDAITEYDTHVAEGTAHHGTSALIDLIATTPR